MCAPMSSRLNNKNSQIDEHANYVWRMNESDIDAIQSYATLNILLPENFAFRLVSARSTEASGLDERTL